MNNILKIFSVFLILLISGVVYLSLLYHSPNKKRTNNVVEKNSTIELKFAHNTPVDSALHRAALRFADEVQKKSNNEVKVKVYPSQQLGNDHQMVEKARNGEIDILLTPTAKMSVAVPSMQYADLPFYFPTRKDVYMMLDGEPGKMLLNNLRDIGLVGVTFWENGFKHFTGNTALVSPEDFKGKKIRVMKSRIIIDQFKAFGAKPVTIDFYSTKEALQNGVVDGQENPLVAIVSMNFHKAQSDFTLSEHAYLGYVFSISEKSFKNLPQNIRVLLVETAKSITPWEREETRKNELKLLEIIKKEGLKIHELNSTQREKFAKLTSNLPKKYEDVIGVDVISKTQELLYDKYDANGSNILIGIDADLSMDGKKAGLAIKRGVQLAVDKINKNGGLLGKRVFVIAKDHRTIAEQGIRNIEAFAKHKNLAAVIGGKHSPIVKSEIETIQKLKIPYIIPWAAASELSENGYEDNYIFRVSANDRYASEFIAKAALKEHKKIALLVENTIWGRGNLENMTSYFKKRGSKCSSFVIFNRGQKLFESDIDKVVASGADAVILVSNPVEGGAIVQEIAKRETPLPIISHWGILGGDFFKNNRSVLEKVDLKFFQIDSLNQSDSDAARSLRESYLKEYMPQKNKIELPSALSQAYDAVMLLALAINKAHSIDHPKIKKALEELTLYNGVIKNYDVAFTKKRHDALNEDDYFMAKFSKDGSIIKADIGESDR